MKKCTWTIFNTYGLFDRFGDLDEVESLIANARCPALVRSDNPPEAIGFAPWREPMGSDFSDSTFDDGAGHLWRWYVRIDRISVSTSTARLIAQKFVSDDAPGLSEGAREVWDTFKTDADRMKFALDYVLTSMRERAPVTITLVPVYLDTRSGTARVCAPAGSKAANFVAQWLNKVETAVLSRNCMASTGIYQKTPAFLLCERYGRLPVRLLRAIPGEFNGAEDDGDQTELDPTDLNGILLRLSHYGRDFLTWLTYRSVAGRKLEDVPAVEPGDEPYTVEVHVNAPLTLRRSQSDFMEIDSGADDPAATAAFRDGCKVSIAQIRFDVTYPNGDLRCFWASLGVDLAPVAVALPVTLDEENHDGAATEDLLECMKDFEDLLKRLLCIFAWHRSGALWPIERDAMLVELYKRADVRMPEYMIARPADPIDVDMPLCRSDDAGFLASLGHALFPKGVDRLTVEAPGHAPVTLEAPHHE